VVHTQPAKDDFAKGMVFERVVSAGDETKTYALYLPTDYTATRKFPILYCFDSQARGSVWLHRGSPNYCWTMAADPNGRASLRKKLHPGHGPKYDVDTTYEYRDVTPLGWGRQFHAKVFVSEPAMRLIEERGGQE
jgi:hypothetical protein